MRRVDVLSATYSFVDLGVLYMRVLYMAPRLDPSLMVGRRGFGLPGVVERSDAARDSR